MDIWITMDLYLYSKMNSSDWLLALPRSCVILFKTFQETNRFLEYFDMNLYET
jgi:hypothetical protein